MQWLVIVSGKTRAGQRLWQEIGGIRPAAGFLPSRRARRSTPRTPGAVTRPAGNCFAVPARVRVPIGAIQTMEACPSPPFCPEIANPVCVWPWSTGACREPGLSTPISDRAASHIGILSYGSVITRQACRTGRKECVCGVKGLSMGWSGEHRICHA